MGGNERTKTKLRTIKVKMINERQEKYIEQCKGEAVNRTPSKLAYTYGT